MRVGSIDFNPDWKTSVLTLCLLPLLISLGVWQLDREQEKIAILSSYVEKEARLPVSLEQQWDVLKKDSNPAFTSVKLTGRFDNTRTLLLDNRIQNAKVGFELIQAFVLSNRAAQTGENEGKHQRQLVWVNRGWLQAPLYRTEVPELELLDEEISLTANIYVPLGDPVVLSESVEQKLGAYQLVQSIDMTKLAESTTNEEVFPYLLRLQALSTAALSVNWATVNSEPAKHRGYAVQWFTMAFALIVFYLIRSCSRTKKER